MATDEISDPPSGDADGAGATEPITLTDPDGSVTRVAPWSSWTREQVRAPGGEPALVTRLDQGQLWFAAGRRRSPWRHEVLVGPATVSTPRGRFHVTAEPDGGATIACLAGRTRVVAGLREPVVLGPDQTAAVASDGATLVVMDRTSGEPLSTHGDDLAADPLEPVADVDGAEDAAIEPPAVPLPAVAGGGDDGVDDDDGVHVPQPHGDDDRRRLPWLPEIVAVAALLAVLVAALVVFGGSSDDQQDVAAVATSSIVPSTSEEPTTTTEDDPTTTTATPTTTEAPSTTVATSTTPPAVAAPGTAEGSLAACRRGDGGVVATINLSHRSGGPGRFAVSVGLVDGGGQVFAQGVAQSATLDRGATQPVDVLVPVAGSVRGACELLGVTAA